MRDFVRVSLAGVLVSACLSAAASAEALQVEIGQFGLYDASVLGHTASPATATGSFVTLGGIRLLEETNRVCARRGVTFGFHYRVRPSNGEVAAAGRWFTKLRNVDYVTQFPAPGLTNDDGKTFEQNRYSRSVMLDQADFRSFTFEHDWEMAIGEWAFQFFRDGEKIGEKRFIVEKCADPIG